MTIRIHLTSVFVDDQERALRFYADVLGFELRSDEPVGNGDRWLTVAAPGQEGVELLLEPASHPAVGPSRARSPLTASHWRHSRSTASKPSMTDSSTPASRSRSRPRRWDRSPLQSSTTPAATSSSSSRRDLARPGTPAAARARHQHNRAHRRGAEGDRRSVSAASTGRLLVGSSRPERADLHPSDRGGGLRSGR